MVASASGRDMQQTMLPRTSGSSRTATGHVSTCSHTLSLYSCLRGGHYPASFDDNYFLRFTWGVSHSPHRKEENSTAVAEPIENHSCGPWRQSTRVKRVAVTIAFHERVQKQHSDKITIVMHWKEGGELADCIADKFTRTARTNTLEPHTPYVTLPPKFRGTSKNKKRNPLCYSLRGPRSVGESDR